jgi:hypothetical protein
MGEDKGFDRDTGRCYEFGRAHVDCRRRKFEGALLASEHGSARSQRSPCPPDVESRDVAVPDGFLAARMGGNAFDGQVNFDEAFGVAHLTTDEH